MANNDSIFNAVLSGAAGAFQERWISSDDSASYSSFTTSVVLIAEAVDSEIPSGSIDLGERCLMQAIAQGVFAGRFPSGDNFSDIATSIVALYDSLSAELLPEASGGGSSLATGAALTGSDETLVISQRYVMPAGMTIGVPCVVTLTPGADGKGYLLEIGTQADDVNIDNGGGGGGTLLTVVAGTRFALWCSSDGTDLVSPVSMPLGAEPT
jgi:hypothetical protein